MSRLSRSAIKISRLRCGRVAIAAGWTGRWKGEVISSGEVGRHNMHTGAKMASRYLPDNGDMAVRDNKFQLRPVACAVRTRRPASLLHGRLAIYPIHVTWLT